MMSRGEELLVRMKRRRLLRGQFRVSTLLVVMVLAAIVIALPGLLGLDAGSFWGIVMLLAYSMAPLAVFATYQTFLIRSAQRYRVGVALFAVVAVVLPVWCFSVAAADDGVVLLVLATVSFAVWVPQIVMLAFLWDTLFSRVERGNRGTVEDRLNDGELFYRSGHEVEPLSHDNH